MLFLHEVKLDYTDLLRVEMEIIEYLFLKNLIHIRVYLIFFNKLANNGHGLSHFQVNALF